MEELIALLSAIAYMLFIGFISVCSLFGIYRSFQKSILLGLFCFIMPITFTIIGAYELIFKKRLLDKL